MYSSGLAARRHRSSSARTVGAVALWRRECSLLSSVFMISFSRTRLFYPSWWKSHSNEQHYILPERRHSVCSTCVWMSQPASIQKKYIFDRLCYTSTQLICHCTACNIRADTTAQCGPYSIVASWATKDIACLLSVSSCYCSSLNIDGYSRSLPTTTYITPSCFPYIPLTSTYVFLSPSKRFRDQWREFYR